MRPIGKYIAIKAIKEKITTGSGLLLSGQDVDDIRYKKAEVIAPGSDVSVIKKGDTVYYDSRAGYSMFIEDEQLTIIREHDVVVVV